MKNNKIFIIIIIGDLCLNARCSSKHTPDPTPPVTTAGTISIWLTKGDKSALLQKQTNLLAFTSSTNANPTIEIDSTITYQTVDGFGYTLTGGSAYHINRL